VAAAAPGAEVGIDQKFNGELHVLGGERLTVVPGDAFAQFELPLKAISGNAAVLDRRHLGCQAGIELPVRIDAEQRIKDGEMHALVDLDVQEMRVEHRRLLRKADHHLAFRRRRASGMGLAKAQQARCSEAGGAQPQHRQGLPPVGAEGSRFAAHATPL
jgi:hypothetical protein